MRLVSHLLLLLCLPVSSASADLPRKAPLTKYSSLWTDSPFTSKPPPAEQAPPVNPLEDYALAGVSPIPDGYRVTILNRKNPGQRIIVETHKPSEGFKILSVIRKPGDPLGTVVRMASGSSSGTVSFDESLLKLEPPPAPKVAPANLPQIPGAQPPQPGNPNAATNQPRRRVVPPPTPGTRQPPGLRDRPTIPQSNTVRPTRRNR